MSSVEYVHVGSHADVLASGRHIGPGERVTTQDLDLDPETGVGDVPLVEEGVLVDVKSFDTGDSNQQSRDELNARARDLGIEGRSKMTVDELRQAVADAETKTAEGDPNVAA